MFEDRKDAGKKLALALKEYKNKGVIVLAIPRGGVEVGYEVAKYLHAKLSLIICRKLGIPTNPEAGFGAISEDGSYMVLENIDISKNEIEKIKNEQMNEIRRRILRLRKGRPLQPLKGKEVVLVDDGLAMGVTMHVAIITCRKKGAKKIIVAVPVSGIEVAESISKIADKLIVLEKPRIFYSVAQAYKNWYDVGDEEVLNFIENERR